MATRQQGYGMRWNRKAVVATGYSVAEAEGTGTTLAGGSTVGGFI